MTIIASGTPDPTDIETVRQRLHELGAARGADCVVAELSKRSDCVSLHVELIGADGGKILEIVAPNVCAALDMCVESVETVTVQEAIEACRFT